MGPEVDEEDMAKIKRCLLKVAPSGRGFNPIEHHL